jgi:8-oxo-dGTP pyrophosphatase MutT (NUDIX family)
VNKFTKSWKESADIELADRAVAIRQVYVWLLTTDGKTVIVSKDDIQWQLPGGKPELDESFIETAIREVDEETGTDISAYKDKLTCFGYYVINEPKANPIDYLQVRLYLHLPLTSAELGLHTDHETFRQSTENRIRSVSTVNLREVTKYIPWMSDAEEYHYLMDTHINS